MAHDAFISYSKDDKETVDAICQALEDNGLRCWYAPRDIPLGADWDASLVEALSASRVMILVWTTHSDQSKQVKREVALALDEIGVTVIPYRTEAIDPSRLRYYLSGIQWFDASTPPPEANLRRLVEQVKIALPIVGQLLVSEEERLKRAETPPQYPLEEEQTNADEEPGLLSEVENLQDAEADALEEAEAAAYRQARLRDEVEALQHAGPKILPPGEAEVLRRATEANAVDYAQEKARHVAKVESLHQAVKTALELAEEGLSANGTDDALAEASHRKTEGQKENAGDEPVR